MDSDFDLNTGYRLIPCNKQEFNFQSKNNNYTTLEQ